MMKVLITDPVHELMFERFETLGFESVYKPDITEKEVFETIHKYDGLIVNSKIFVQKPLIDKAEKLKFVGRLGSGMEHIDQKYLAEKGIGCFSSPEGNRDAVAEHVIGMLLMLLNKLYRSNRQLKSSVWEREANRGVELMGKTIGIIGYGNTGKALAKKLSGFEMNILVYDKYVYGFHEPFVKEVTLNQLLSESDIISFHLPLTQETKHLISKPLISQMVRKPIVVNSSRGEIANTKDLIESLKTGSIRGLCVDVFEDEPINKEKNNPLSVYEELLAFDNVCASPHVAGWTVESRVKLAAVLMDRIEEYVKSNVK